MQMNSLNSKSVLEEYNGYIIDSLLDLDFYKLTMLKAMCRDPKHIEYLLRCVNYRVNLGA